VGVIAPLPGAIGDERGTDRARDPRGAIATSDGSRSVLDASE